MATTPCGKCLSKEMQAFLENDTQKVKEKRPAEMAALGNMEAADRIAQAERLRARYDVATLVNKSEEDFVADMEAGGAPVAGGVIPPDYTLPPRWEPLTPGHAGAVPLASVDQVRIKGWFARYLTPMREIFGAPHQIRVWASHEQSQEVMMKFRAKVMDSLVKNDVVPTRWWGKKRPNMNGASPDSLEQIGRKILSLDLENIEGAGDDLTALDPNAFTPTRMLTPNELQVAKELRPMYSALVQQINGSGAKFIANYTKAGRPLEVNALMSALIRKAAMDRIMKPTLAELDPFVPKAMSSLWNEWKGLLQGRPTNAEKQLSISILKAQNALASLPGPVGNAFRGKMNGRASLAFSEFLSSWYYAGAMGARPSSVIRNLLDSNQTFANLGGLWLAKGIAYAGKNGLKEAHEAKVLTSAAEALTQEERQLLGGSAMGDLTSAMLVAFRKVDAYNRAFAYYGAKLKFEHYLEKGRIGDLIDGKGLIVGARKDLRAQLHFLTKGELADPALAKEIYSRDSAFTTQYLYGRANTPISMQGPIGRLIGMFSQWPINYAQFLKSTLEPGRRSAFILHLASTYGAIWMAGTYLDINMGSWLGAGSMPSEMGFSGPVFKTAMFGGNALLSGATVLQGEVLGGKWADDKRMQFAKRQFSESTRQMGSAITSIGIPGAAVFHDAKKAYDSGNFSDFLAPSASFQEAGQRRGRQPRTERGSNRRLFLDKGFSDE